MTEKKGQRERRVKWHRSTRHGLIYEIIRWRKGEIDLESKSRQLASEEAKVVEKVWNAEGGWAGDDWL